MQLVSTSCNIRSSIFLPTSPRWKFATAEGWATVPSSTHYVTIQTHPRCLQRCSRERKWSENDKKIYKKNLALHAFKIISLMGMSPSPQRFVTSGSRTDPVAPTWQNTDIVVAITNSSIGVYFFPCHAPPRISAILRLIHDLIDWPSDLPL